MQHAILLLEDHYGGGPTTSSYNDDNLFNNYEIYIGDDSDWNNNVKCPGGPFMQLTDNDSYSVDPYSGQTIWNFGRETWCNLKGQYTSIVADLSQGGTVPSSYEKRLCQLGIMGTEYVRDPPLADRFQFVQGTIGTFQVDHISSALPFGTEMDLMLRQVEGKELSFITFTAIVGATKVTVDATSEAVGSYELHIESYDVSGGVYSTLHTDMTTILISSITCEIDQASLDQCQSQLDALPIELEAYSETGYDFFSYHEQLAIVENAFYREDRDNIIDNCGEVTVSLKNNYTFLTLDEEITLLTLLPSAEIEAAIYEDAMMIYQFGDQTLQTLIKATVLTCNVQKVAFEEAQSEVDYEIGSGQLSWVIPPAQATP